jgi:hypothetical protein
MSLDPKTASTVLGTFWETRLAPRQTLTAEVRGL